MSFTKNQSNNGTRSRGSAAQNPNRELPRLPVCIGGRRRIRLRDAAQTQDRPCPRVDRRRRA
jgi:hypothetical protein